MATRPETCTLLLWLMLLLYPSVGQASSKPFDCMDVPFSGQRVLRADPSVDCDGDEWRALAALGAIGTTIYSLGFPLVCLLVTYAGYVAQKAADEQSKSGNASIDDDKGTRRAARAKLLSRSYVNEFWWWESLEVLRKYLLTSVVSVVAPNTEMQMFFGAIISIAALVLLVGYNPYADRLCGRVANFCLGQLVITYVAAMLFFDHGSGPRWNTPEEEANWGAVLITVNIAVFGLLAFGAGGAVRGAVRDMQGAVRSRRTGELARLPPRPDGVAYDLFISHVWSTGQDQVRVIKERLKQLVPGVRVFLDVDDLHDITRLEEYVESSGYVVIFLSAGYLQSRNCMRELRSAIGRKRPLLVVRETERARGAMTNEEVLEACDNDEASALAKALLEAPQIEWFRLSDFQQTSLLQIARHLFPAAEADELYIPGGPEEKLSGEALPPPPKQGSHLYVSSQNVGALELSRELGQTFAKIADSGAEPLSVTSDVAAMESAHAFLLLLDTETWSDEGGGAVARKGALAGQAAAAMRKGMKLLLAHECDSHEKRSSCVRFDTFFEPGQTPHHLKAWNIYGNIAVSMYGGEHRDVSLSQLGLNLLHAAEEPRVERPDLVSKSLLVAG